MKIALISIDSRQNERTYHETTPRFGTGVDSMIEAVAAKTGRRPRAKKASLIHWGLIWSQPEVVKPREEGKIGIKRPEFINQNSN